MLSFFLNPWTMIAGVALISAPIIIHLINRLRYRRVRWAAMEFLLKSMKRNRRRIILQQLLLLLMRIIIVLLVGLLLGRFLGLDLQQLQGDVLHVVVIDDTPSMSDANRVNGELVEAFATAKRTLAEDIVGTAAQSNVPQLLQVIYLSEPDEPVDYGRINTRSIEKLTEDLKTRQATPVRGDLNAALQRATTLLLEHKTGRRVLHLLSDFRAVDWKGKSIETTSKILEPLKAAEVTFNLIDTADPPRPEGSEAAPPAHDNLAIIELRPESRTVVRGRRVEFTATIANFSTSERKNVRVVVRRNGEERSEASFSIASIPPGERVTQTFGISSFERVATPERPLDRINVVSCTIENEEGGVPLDNVRHAYVDVQDEIKLLLIEETNERGKEGTESFPLVQLFGKTLSNFKVVLRGKQELEQDPDLGRYSVIYLLDVPALNEKATQRLEEYVKQGGGLAVVLGPNTSQTYYNTNFQKGGFFPFTLERKVDRYDGLDDDQKLAVDLDRSYRIFPRNVEHPLFAPIYRDAEKRETYDFYLRWLKIEQYWQARRDWQKAGPEAAEELLTLANFRSPADYKPRIDQLLKDDRLPTSIPRVRELLDAVRAAARAESASLVGIAERIDALLEDRTEITVEDDRKVRLQALWREPAYAPLRAELAQLAEDLRYGDPFLVARRFGQGRVGVYLSTLSTKWNNWADGVPTPYFVPLQVELQRYLAAASGEIVARVGEPIRLLRDASRYQSSLRVYYVSDDKLRLALERQAGEKQPAAPEPKQNGLAELALPVGFEPYETVVAETAEGVVRFATKPIRRTGVYTFVLDLQAGGDDAGKSPGKQPLREVSALAADVDAQLEGDLTRMPRSELEQASVLGKVVVPGGAWRDQLKDRQSDLSESPWLYLVLLLFLVFEQMLAVHLSFHTAGGMETPLPR